MEKNPAVKQFFWEMFADQFKEREDAMFKSVSDMVSKEKGKGKGNSPMVAENLPRARLNIQKSPSDTTIYRPAYLANDESEKIINKISNFVEGIRIETNSSDKQREKDPHRVMRTPPVQVISTPKQSKTKEVVSDEREEDPDAKEIAENLVNGSNQYQATLQPPKGELN